MIILPAAALADSNGVVSGNTTGNGTLPVITLPGTNLPGAPQQNLTSQQMQSIMMFRALQSRGSGRVRTGYPQFIPLGGPGFFPYAQQAVGTGDQQQVDDERQAKIDRRIAARKAAEEKKRASRAAAKARNLAKTAAAKQAKAGKADNDADSTDKDADLAAPAAGGK